MIKVFGLHLRSGLVIFGQKVYRLKLKQLLRESKKMSAQFIPERQPNYQFEVCRLKEKHLRAYMSLSILHPPPYIFLYLSKGKGS